MIQRLVVGITGASGALYALRFLKACHERELQMDLVVSDYGHRLLIEETGLNLKSHDVVDFLEARYGPLRGRGEMRIHRTSDLAAPIASGSQRWDAMVVIPCSMKTLSAIARAAASNLLERAADVTLKEGRPLVLVPRETPLHVLHLENMLQAARAGARLVPAMPAFYQKPRAFEDLADFICGRVFSVLGIPHDLFQAWEG